MSEVRRRLEVLREDVADRCARAVTTQPDWPCQAGCDDCCRSLHAVPQVSPVEWDAIAAAIAALPRAEREIVHAAFAERRARGDTRPIVCPLLDRDRGLCRIYEARPVACRTYGFYVERESVLGCMKILAFADARPDIVWARHDLVQTALDALGSPRSIVDY